MNITRLDRATVRRWKRYPEYRPVQTETLSHLPTHWRTNRLKFMTRINPEVLGEDTHPDYELRYIDISNVDSLGRIHEEQTFRFEDAPSRARRRVRHGDVLISTVRTYLRAITTIEAPPDNLIVSTGFAVLRAGDGYNPRFLWRLIQSNEFVDAVVNHSEGVGYPAINPTELGGLPVWVPPLAEQRAIAAFLDRETDRIDALIGHKERLIALLEEKRQAVITHAITRGLAPSASLKDSGIPWLGMVPEHWQVQRIKWVAKLESGHTPDKKVEAYWTNCDIPWVSLNDTGYLKDHDYISETAYQVNQLGLANSSARLLPARAVVFSRDATIGRCAITTRPMAVSQHFIAWLCRDSILPEYLLRVLRAMQQELERLTMGATIKTIGMPDVRTLTTPVPPLPEQEKIVRHIEAQTARIDKALGCIRDNIDLLREHRTALISAAVTGQIDVRGEATP